MGAIRRRFFWPPDDASSSSLSLVSLLVPPAPPETDPCGVSGGVVMGTPVTLAELVAVMPGTWPPISGGLLMTPVGAEEDWVMTEEVELERAGDEGRWLTKEAGGGEAAATELKESRCR